MANEKPYTFADWQADGSRNEYRTILIELDHSAGTVYLATKAYLSDQHNAYDDWLIRSPVMEYSLLSLVDGIGDIDAFLPLDVPDDWENYNFRGYAVRFYSGDVTWPKSKFRLIGIATNEGCRDIGENQYRFEIVGAIQDYSRTYASADSTQTNTVQTVINWITGQAGVASATFLNMDNGELSIITTLEVTESSNMYADLKLVAGSVGAYPRVNQLGELEIFKPDTGGVPTITLSNDDIERDSISEVDYIPAYKQVILGYGLSDATVKRPTLAKTGKLSEDIEIGTALSNLSDAEARADHESVRHAKSQRTKSMNVFNLANLMQEGMYISIDSDRLKGSGVVEGIKHELDTTRSTLEVLMQ